MNLFRIALIALFLVFPNGIHSHGANPWKAANYYLDGNDRKYREHMDSFFWGMGQGVNDDGYKYREFANHLLNLYREKRSKRSDDDIFWRLNHHHVDWDTKKTLFKKMAEYRMENMLRIAIDQWKSYDYYCAEMYGHMKGEGVDTDWLYHHLAKTNSYCSEAIDIFVKRNDLNERAFKEAMSHCRLNAVNEDFDNLGRRDRFTLWYLEVMIKRNEDAVVEYSRQRVSENPRDYFYGLYLWSKGNEQRILEMGKYVCKHHKWEECGLFMKQKRQPVDSKDFENFLAGLFSADDCGGKNKWEIAEELIRQTEKKDDVFKFEDIDQITEERLLEYVKLAYQVERGTIESPFLAFTYLYYQTDDDDESLLALKHFKIALHPERISTFDLKIFTKYSAEKRNRDKIDRVVRVALEMPAPHQLFFIDHLDNPKGQKNIGLLDNDSDYLHRLFRKIVGKYKNSKAEIFLATIMRYYVEKGRNSALNVIGSDILVFHDVLVKALPEFDLYLKSADEQIRIRAWELFLFMLTTSDAVTINEGLGGIKNKFTEFIEHLDENGKKYWIGKAVGYTLNRCTRNGIVSISSMRDCADSNFHLRLSTKFLEDLYDNFVNKNHREYTGLIWDALNSMLLDLEDELRGNWDEDDEKYKKLLERVKKAFLWIITRNSDKTFGRNLEGVSKFLLADANDAFYQWCAEITKNPSYAESKFEETKSLLPRRGWPERCVDANLDSGYVKCGVVLKVLISVTEPMQYVSINSFRRLLEDPEDENCRVLAQMKIDSLKSYDSLPEFDYIGNDFALDDVKELIHACKSLNIAGFDKWWERNDRRAVLQSNLEDCWDAMIDSSKKNPVVGKIMIKKFLVLHAERKVNFEKKLLDQLDRLDFHSELKNEFKHLSTDIKLAASVPVAVTQLGENSIVTWREMNSAKRREGTMKMALPKDLACITRDPTFKGQVVSVPAVDGILDAFNNDNHIKICESVQTLRKELPADNPLTIPIINDGKKMVLQKFYQFCRQGDYQRFRDLYLMQTSLKNNLGECIQEAMFVDETDVAAVEQAQKFIRTLKKEHPNKISKGKIRQVYRNAYRAKKRIMCRFMRKTWRGTLFWTHIRQYMSRLFRG